MRSPLLRFVLPALVSLLVAWSGAFAQTSRAPLGNAIVEYDAAVWRVSELSGVASLMFVCVAADCEGEPAVFAAATATPEQGGPAEFFGRDAYSDSQVLDFVPSGDGIPLSASVRWSGCRAMDAPVLAAYGIHGEVAYHFGTMGGSGCNFGPRMPEHRFLELLHGLKAISPP